MSVITLPVCPCSRVRANEQSCKNKNKHSCERENLASLVGRPPTAPPTTSRRNPSVGDRGSRVRGICARSPFASIPRAGFGTRMGRASGASIAAVCAVVTSVLGDAAASPGQIRTRPNHASSRSSEGGESMRGFRLRRPRVVFAVALVTLGLAAGAAQAVTPGVDPPTYTNSLNPGDSVTITKTVHTPIIPPKPDIIFLADTTGSMGPTLANVQANATAIMNTIRTAQSDSAFAAAQYKDFDCGLDAFASSSIRPLRLRSRPSRPRSAPGARRRAAAVTRPRRRSTRSSSSAPTPLSASGRTRRP